MEGVRSDSVYGLSARRRIATAAALAILRCEDMATWGIAPWAMGMHTAIFV